MAEGLFNKKLLADAIEKFSFPRNKLRVRIENTTRCVIELKNAKTDLDKKQSSYKNNVSPVEQAFGYVSKYDQCDLNINILGHIFEQSLDDIEQLKDEIDGAKQDEKKTKKSNRKKDGIFYTPNYITAYIVEQTLGKLCEAKRAEMSLDAILSEPPPKSERERETPRQQLNAYRAWLLSFTICDPACGSGAFLNAALDFLIAEHHNLDKLAAKISGDNLVHSDIENNILENNIYGVDINEESVEIAQLSLWLRTARKGRKLSNLSHRIKLGNSLIDDKIIAGDKAFDWQREFPEIFERENPGFDVVIGNPQQLASLTERRTALTSDLQERRRKFLKRVTDNFAGVKINRVLDGFAAFVAEMQKQKHPIPLKSQSEWDDFFTTAATACRTLSSTIKQTDVEIDRLVYELYGLSDEEIGIVEGKMV